MGEPLQPLGRGLVAHERGHHQILRAVEATGLDHERAGQRSGITAGADQADDGGRGQVEHDRHRPHGRQGRQLGVDLVPEALVAPGLGLHRDLGPGVAQADPEGQEVRRGPIADPELDRQQPGPLGQRRDVGPTEEPLRPLLGQRRPDLLPPIYQLPPQPLLTAAVAATDPPPLIDVAGHRHHRGERGEDQESG